MHRTSEPMPWPVFTFSFGKNHVFLIGTHPEIEEDSDRDSVSFGDEFEDRGTDWEPMKSAVVLCYLEGWYPPIILNFSFVSIMVLCLP
jgi:hypothetical protein